MKRTKPILVYVTLLLYTALPILCVMVSGAIAKHYGCRLDESEAHPCQAFGRDIGGTLVTLFVSGWFMLITVPTGLMGLVVYTVGLVIAKASNKAGDKASKPKEGRL